jgi:hypothetical protein
MIGRLGCALIGSGFVCGHQATDEVNVARQSIEFCHAF